MANLFAIIEESSGHALGRVLETIPPGQTSDIDDLFKNEEHEINSADIQLHCDSDKCKGFVSSTLSIRKKTQFSRAVDDIKAAIPSRLLIRSQNPLVLLHSALSEGLHAKTETECLDLAKSIRVVLTELAERISIALKDDAELQQAITTLLRGAPKEKDPKEEAQPTEN